MEEEKKEEKPTTKEETAKPVTEKAPEKKKMPKALKIVLWVAGAFVAFIVVMVIVAMVATSGAAKTSDQFINALQAGDGATSYSLFSSEAKAQVPEDEFNVVVAQIGPILNTEESKTSQSVSAETGSASTAQIVYEIEGTDGVTYIFAVDLVKEDGEWKVLRFDSDSE